MTNRFPRDKYDINTIQCGDIHIFDHRPKSGTPKRRPCVITGIYHGADNDVVAFEVFKLTTRLEKMGPGCLPSKNAIRQPGQSRAGRIITTQSLIIPPKDLSIGKGPVGRLKPSFWPDLLIRRICNILDYKGKLTLFDPKINIADIKHRTGFTFSNIPFKYDNHLPPDMTGSDACPDIERTLPENMSLTQDGVDAITRWAIQKLFKASETQTPIEWHKPGQWPHWESVNFKGEITCASPPEKEFPCMQTKVTQQPSRTTSSAAQSLAANRLKALGVLQF